MLLRLQKYDLSVKYVSGKLLHVADTLSCAHATNNSNQVDDGEMELAILQFVQHLPLADDQKEALRSATTSDRVIFLKLDGPAMLSMFLKMYVSTEMCTMKFILPRILLFMGDRLIVPASSSSVLQLIHEGDMGIERCKARNCLRKPERERVMKS